MITNTVSEADFSIRGDLGASDEMSMGSQPLSENYEEMNEDRFQLDHLAVRLYQDQQHWKEEMALRPVEQWTVSEIRIWVESNVRRSAHHHGHPKLIELVSKLLVLMEEENMNGDLLLAGGKSYLAEKASVVLSGKSDLMRLKHATSMIFDAVTEAIELRGSVSYWDRIWMKSAAGQALCDEFEATAYCDDKFAKNKDGRVGERLRLALEPRPLESILHETIRHVENASNVVEADSYVSKKASSSTCNPSHFFKVVSIAPRNDPDVVWCNLIYVRTDVASVVQRDENRDSIFSSELMIDKTNEGSAKVNSRKQRRKHKQNKAASGRKKWWELLASVDFAQHGSAPPGHWHLNRNSCGDVLPHLSLSLKHDDNEDRGKGSERQVWHGEEDCCPLWWQFIPNGMVYKREPERLKRLFHELVRLDTHL
eukprot:CAMPEP_0195519144 /NCGR_PEP_ID=MMETSP0794_2-20130614/14455_1 /TAXON_ID=515487 /ORGANISM="Stephanopyxis turris, Strain CCMP 815" /LENGTH=424 /DNA_ID=CAMNT_0040648253 /DNA_START=67 /DNA_END=1341 /DNA_ORIENTATION=+